MINQFYNEISKYKEGIHKLNRGAKEEEIINAERQLNIRLPELYREFLKKYNGGELFAVPAGTIIYKVIEDDEEVKKGKGYINEGFNKEKRWPGMPESFLVIALKSYGDLICLDIKGMHDNDAFILNWDHEAGTVTRIWGGLEEWLMCELEIGKLIVNYDGTKVN